MNYKDKLNLKNKLLDNADFKTLCELLKKENYNKIEKLEIPYIGKFITTNMDEDDIKTLLDLVDLAHYDGLDDYELIKVINQFLFSLIVAANIWHAINTNKLDKKRDHALFFDTAYWQKAFPSYIIMLNVGNFTVDTELSTEICIRTKDSNNEILHLIIRLITSPLLIKNSNDYLSKIIIQFWNASKHNSKVYTVPATQIDINFLNQGIDNVL